MQEKHKNKHAQKNALSGESKKISYKYLFGKYAEHARKSDYESLQTGLEEIGDGLQRAINLCGYLRDDSSGREHSKMNAILDRIKAADTRIKAAQKTLTIVYESMLAEVVK